MLLITTALMLEARPLQGLLQLDSTSGLPFPVYSGNSTVLLVTGSGAQRAAAATGWAMGHFGSVDCAVNLGMAAAGSDFGLHHWYLIHSVLDATTGRRHVPDLLWDFKLPEAALLTVGKPVETNPGWNGLVDMEAGGFFEAARQFLSPDRIVMLKWVSDRFSAHLDPRETGQAFDRSCSLVEPVLRHFSGISQPSSVLHSEEMERLVCRINLTETQEHFLRKWLHGYLLRGGDFQSLLAMLPNKPPATKAENKRLLDEIKDVLKG